jgi:hypothetical protein
MSETMHQLRNSNTISLLRRILRQPLAEGRVQGRTACPRNQLRSLDLGFVRIEGNVFHSPNSVRDSDLLFLAANAAFHMGNRYRSIVMNELAHLSGEAQGRFWAHGLTAPR